PADLAAWTQNHWSIENKLHWVRDVTFDEDRSQVRSAALPRVMASLRNTTLNLSRLTGFSDIATATRYHSRNPQRAITCALLAC
ncbi:MAG: transposase, partial [Nocardioides sp.]